MNDPREHRKTHKEVEPIEYAMRDIAQEKLYAHVRALIMASLFGLICFVGLSRNVYSQAAPTATRSGDLQVGGTFSVADSDYTADRLRGYGIFANFDFRYHFGVEAEFHQVNDPSGSQVYERTYEIGPRYVLHYGRFRPYATVLYGRGVFNYPKVGPGLGANLAYNIAAVGGGMDYRLTRSVNLRADYEYQDWMGFMPHGLTPAMVEIGAAYRFH
jgi:opacity protein-like surface antigen